MRVATRLGLRTAAAMALGLTGAGCGGGGGDVDADGDSADDPDGGGEEFVVEVAGEDLATFRIAPSGEALAVVYGTEERIGLVTIDDPTLIDVAPGATYLTGIAWLDVGTLLFSGDGGIFQVGVDGEGLVSIDDAFAATGLDVSPDGTTLAYGVNGGDGVLLTLADSSARTLPTRCAVARFSPDGDTLACDAQGELVLIDVATLEPTTLVTGLDFFAPLDWFADGERLAFASSDGIEEVVVATGERRRVHDAFAVIDLDLSADDGVLLYRQNGETAIRGVTLP